MAVSPGMSTVKSLGAGLLAVALSGCGDIGALRLDLLFPDAEVETQVRALRLVVREGPRDGSVGCNALWGVGQPGLRQTEAVVAYPNRDDVLAAAVSLEYESLSLFVYGHRDAAVVEGEDGEKSLEISGSPLVGGCIDQGIDDSNATLELELELEMAPGA